MTQYIINEDQDKKSKDQETKEEKENLNFEEFFFTNFNPESRKLLEDLQQDDPDFDNKIEKILDKLGDQIDLSYVQSEILLLIISKFKDLKKKDKSLIDEISDKKSNKILKHIKDLSQYLINQRSQEARKTNKSIESPQDKYYSLSKESLKNLRGVIKRFVVYELYKIVNPHQIAGETRKQTFIHNVILRGLESAKHYEGGTEGEIKQYGQKFINNLVKKNRSFKSNNGVIR